MIAGWDTQKVPCILQCPSACAKPYTRVCRRSAAHPFRVLKPANFAMPVGPGSMWRGNNSCGIDVAFTAGKLSKRAVYCSFTFLRKGKSPEKVRRKATGLSPNSDRAAGLPVKGDISLD
jgi:hypothetical protein